MGVALLVFHPLLQLWAGLSGRKTCPCYDEFSLSLGMFLAAAVLATGKTSVRVTLSYLLVYFLFHNYDRQRDPVGMELDFFTADPEAG